GVAGRVPGRPIARGPVGGHVLGALRERDDVPLRDPDVLEQTPGGERLPRRLGSSQRGRPVSDSVLEDEVGVPTAEQLAHMVAERAVAIHFLRFRGTSFGGHAPLLSSLYFGRIVIGTIVVPQCSRKTVE